MTEQTPNDKATHAEVYDATCRQIIAAVLAFAEGVKPALSQTEVAKMFLGASVWLLLPAVGPEATADMLRQLTAAISRGEARPKLN